MNEMAVGISSLLAFTGVRRELAIGSSEPDADPDHHCESSSAQPLSRGKVETSRGNTAVATRIAATIVRAACKHNVLKIGESPAVVVEGFSKDITASSGAAGRRPEPTAAASIYITKAAASRYSCRFTITSALGSIEGEIQRHGVLSFEQDARSPQPKPPKAIRSVSLRFIVDPVVAPGGWKPDMHELSGGFTLSRSHQDYVASASFTSLSEHRSGRLVDPARSSRSRPVTTNQAPATESKPSRHKHTKHDPGCKAPTRPFQLCNNYSKSDLIELLLPELPHSCGRIDDVTVLDPSPTRGDFAGHCAYVAVLRSAGLNLPAEKELSLVRKLRAIGVIGNAVRLLTEQQFAAHLCEDYGAVVPYLQSQLDMTAHSSNQYAGASELSAIGTALNIRIAACVEHGSRDSGLAVGATVDEADRLIAVVNSRRQHMRPVKVTTTGKAFEDMSISTVDSALRKVHQQWIAEHKARGRDRGILLADLSVEDLSTIVADAMKVCDGVDTTSLATEAAIAPTRPKPSRDTACRPVVERVPSSVPRSAARRPPSVTAKHQEAKSKRSKGRAADASTKPWRKQLVVRRRSTRSTPSLNLEALV